MKAINKLTLQYPIIFVVSYCLGYLGVHNKVAQTQSGTTQCPGIHSSASMLIDEMVELNKEHNNWVKSIAAYSHELNITHVLNGGVVQDQAMVYRQIAKKFLLSQSTQPVVCETGFFVGISSHLWMDSITHATPGGGGNRVTLNSFDLDFPEGIVAKLRKIFATQEGEVELIIHRGNTRDTIPAFQPKQPCNLLSIDGSHSDWDPYWDLVDLLPKSKCGSIVLFDDTFDSPLKEKGVVDNNPTSSNFFNFCSKSYWRAVEEGLVEHVTCLDLGFKSEWGGFPKGFCIAIARGGSCQ